MDFRKNVPDRGNPPASGGVSPPSPERHRDGALTRSRDGLRYIKNVKTLKFRRGRSRLVKVSQTQSNIVKLENELMVDGGTAESGLIKVNQT